MADGVIEFKYRAEYAKSGRASCKGCKKSIGKDDLRLAILTQSHLFDGKIPSWFHPPCFYKKHKPSDTKQIEHFESMKWEDQEAIRKNISESSVNGKSSKSEGKKKRAIKSDGDFSVEYAKSSRAVCRGCEIKIAKGEVRISKKDYESEDAVRYGGKDLWHHVPCFVKLRNELGYFGKGEKLSGFVTLSNDDQKIVKEALPEVDGVKIKKEEVKDEVDGEPQAKKIKVADKDKEVLKKQSKLLFKYKDMLKELKKDEIHRLLSYNNQQDRSCPDSRKDHLADCMAFGALLPCEVCKEGQFVFKSGVGYQCRGNLTEWTKCLKIDKAPKRKSFKIPKDLIENHPEFKSYKCKVSDRKLEFPDTVVPTVIKSEVKTEDAPDSGPKVERFAPLRNLHFFLTGKLKSKKEDLKISIVKLGGTVSSSFNPELLTAVISTEAEVEKCSGKIEEAKAAGIHVVPESFVEEAAKSNETSISDLITKMSIASWGTNLQGRITAANMKSAAMKSEKSKSVYTKSVPSKQTLIVKDGLAVDPDSGVDDIASVFIDPKLGPYSVVLSKFDLQKNRNSYYKMQLLVNDHSSALKKKYFVFRAWGRIGTTIGDKRTEKYSDLDKAKKEFHFHFQDKTGNAFKDKANFRKLPDMYNPVDIQFGNDDTDSLQLSLKSDKTSKLHPSVQELVSMILDVGQMKKVMMEFELDLEKMPLGKLSRKQIQKAFLVLSELQGKDGDIKPAVVIDATNRFYSLVPHNFGMNTPTLLDNKEIIQSKVEMLESLMEMETAYSLLKTTSDEMEVDEHPIDRHYSKLNTDIEVVDKLSEEFTLIEKYVQNTHGDTHRMYKLEIDQLYKIKRRGEEKRFKPFKKLPNRKLLWHGSRITNYAGILSQGLRIAPPEAPPTGYMFGKGIYFADMVTKSANYCMTSRENNVGLLLLCEVALGEMYEKTQSEFIVKLPPGKHSTKGIGVTTPDPNHVEVLEDGLEVPVGKGVKIVDQSSTSLLYNEYIVYDPGQVKSRYLLKAKFNYNY